jgi:AraC family cel operon transcriptional repressor
MTKLDNLVEGMPALRRIAGRHPDYVSRAFRRYTSCSPTEFITGLRLDHAAMLLEMTNRKVLAIAMESGFGDIRQFNRSFRKRYRTTPSSYRIAVRHHTSG